MTVKSCYGVSSVKFDAACEDCEVKAMTTTNPKYELGGVNHLALVCSDMKRTIDFYQGTLGMPLVKTVELPYDLGQHFFFDCGGGDCIAFFWFANSPDAAPGISAPAEMPGHGKSISAVGSMNHIAFSVPADKFDEYVERLKADGIETGMVLNHDDSEMGASKEVHPGTFVRSIYFQDPDGILLEFASWARELTSEDVAHEPKTAADRVADTAVA